MWRTTTLQRPLCLTALPSLRQKPICRALQKRNPHISAHPASSSASSSSSPSSSIRPDKHPESDLDRHLLRPLSTETSKSGTDDAAAHHPWSFDPTITDPELELQASDAECALDDYRTDDPLYVSPGNPEVSRFLDPMAGGAAHNAVKAGCSGMGWVRKGHVVKVKKGLAGGETMKVWRDVRVVGERERSRERMKGKG
ncbi:uncharacterized protein BP01DRAFT_425268 [Aspergillus saccharolyticus JOP 1030-1]|uniref:Uncharacterized protein n=1 Tax=Aspergillus saccharolyticus JOP 1030-1 TaxID=1450539 RepID=A0A318Z6C3_9EURO|nr:hypothetical protein BP01DRAFT_425268 [Aspergillus saccharolyticus JOP 1030-1]PYH42841.1 hypothetical protein BP01DRAFT_425268 [Aspergillus saccharolyticus JOP 1030-1]